MITFLIILAILCRPRHMFFGPRMWGPPPPHHHDFFDHGPGGFHGGPSGFGGPGMF